MDISPEKGVGAEIIPIRCVARWCTIDWRQIQPRLKRPPVIFRKKNAGSLFCSLSCKKSLSTDWIQQHTGRGRGHGHAKAN